MKRILVYSTFLLILLSIVGCTFQKRQYTRGYHVEWAGKKKIKQTNVVSEAKTPSKSDFYEEEEPEFTASNNEEIKPDKKFGFASVVKALTRFYSTSKDSCDRIIDKDGEEILANVTEIGIDIIKYKKCNHLDGPVYSMSKSSVLMIEYKNGNREVFKPANPEPKTEPEYRDIDAVYNEGSSTSKRRLEGLGLAGFIITLVNLPFWWLVSMIFGLVAGVLGIIFGSIGIHRTRKHRTTKWGKGFAITSLILGLIMVVVSLILLLILI